MELDTGKVKYEEYDIEAYKNDIEDLTRFYIQETETKNKGAIISTMQQAIKKVQVLEHDFEKGSI